MTWRITNTFHTSSDEMKQLILDLLVHEGPRVLQEREEDAGETLIEMGIATRGATGAILLSSPYMRMLLLRLAYPMKRISGITVPKLDDLSIDGLKLLQLALEYVAKAVISAPYSMNRNGPSEAVIQAELYSVFKAIGESTGDFKVFVEVKEKPGAAMRLDLMLVDVHGNPIVGYELKVGLLRATDIVSAVRDQAEKYRKDHRLPQMYLVNFVADTSGLDRNLPGRVGNVDCVVFRYSAGFQQLRREPPAVTSAAPSAADTQILYEVKGAEKRDTVFI
ncbi:hypothetical protein BC832DRAFT_124641 [Gaertneriomyces semiglobifer]|nr:hypothetical protein BC832DRAFT_124641 [Gaertneriomyces semiglobifer]